MKIYKSKIDIDGETFELNKEEVFEISSIKNEFILFEKKNDCKKIRIYYRYFFFLLDRGFIEEVIPIKKRSELENVSKI